MMSLPEQEIEPVEDESNESVNEEDDSKEESNQSPSDVQKQSWIYRIFKKDAKLCNNILNGEYENGKCENPKNMQSIYQLRARHSTGKHREERIDFYFDYIDNERNEHHVKTDYDSAQEWIRVNEEKDNIKEMKVKGDYSRFYRKKEVFK